jgi:hypothetical protein
MPFNDADEISLSELSEITGFTETETCRILKTWTDFGMLIKIENTFSIDKLFTK